MNLTRLQELTEAKGDTFKKGDRVLVSGKDKNGFKGPKGLGKVMKMLDDKTVQVKMDAAWNEEQSLPRVCEIDVKHVKAAVTEELIHEDGFFAAEGQQYNDSTEFSDEFYGLCADVQKIKKIIKSPKWLQYMKTFDQNNNGVECEHPARDAVAAITALDRSLSEIDIEFDKGNGMGSTSKKVEPEEPDEDVAEGLLEDQDTWTLVLGSDEGSPRRINGDAEKICKKLLTLFKHDVNTTGDDQAKKDFKEALPKFEKITDPKTLFTALLKSDLCIWDGYNIDLEKNGKTVNKPVTRY